MAVAFGVRPRESSNSFASGANQNCGNFITGTPTSRVTRPPGGGSSLSLAWDTPELAGACGAPEPTNQRRRGCDASARAGAEGWTSTRPSENPRESSNTFASGASQNCGNFITGTPTSRVTRPPGGGSSLSLTWDTPELAGACGAPEPSNQRRRGSDASTRAGAECWTSTRPSENPRESSNIFASGASQNCGNFITGTPTTRVTRPPGGGSSVSLSWDTPEFALACGAPEPCNNRRRGSDAGSRAPSQCNSVANSEYRPRASGGGASTISLAWDAGPSGQQRRSALHASDCHDNSAMQPSGQAGDRAPGLLRALEGRRRNTDACCGATHSSERMEGTEKIPDDDPCLTSPQRMPLEDACVQQHGQQHNETVSASCGSGEEGWTSATTAETRSSTPPAAGMSGEHLAACGKEEIEGSRPRVFKPAIRLRAPPGGDSAFNSDWTGGYMSGPKGGKKLFPEAGGAGANRDAQTLEALRYYADHDESVGKQKVHEGRHRAEKSALDEQRYYLSAGGFDDQTPGKARRGSQSWGGNDCAPRGSFGTGMQVAGRPRTAPGYMCDQDRYTQRGHDGQSSPGMSDTLPLGAEWSSWQSGTDCYSNA